MKARILAACQTALTETNTRITRLEKEEEPIRRQLEDQFNRTLLPTQDVMIPARRVYASLASVTQAFSSHAYAVESARHERNPGPQDVFDTFFRFQEAFHDILESLPEFEVHPDAAEFSVLNRVLDHWLHLTGTVDIDIARYPVWRQVTELIEDLEPSNPSLWSNRVQPLLHQLQTTHYAPVRSILIPKTFLQHPPLPPYPPHCVDEQDTYAPPAPPTRRTGTRRGPSYLISSSRPQLECPDTSATPMDIIPDDPPTKPTSTLLSQHSIANPTPTTTDPSQITTPTPTPSGPAATRLPDHLPTTFQPPPSNYTAHDLKMYQEAEHLERASPEDVTPQLSHMVTRDAVVYLHPITYDTTPTATRHRNPIYSHVPQC